jgi:hypothetical protein
MSVAQIAPQHNPAAPAKTGAALNAADITFVAQAREGDLLVADAVERTRFGRSGIYDVTVRRNDDVVAEFRGRSRSRTIERAEATT